MLLSKPNRKVPPVFVMVCVAGFVPVLAVIAKAASASAFVMATAPAKVAAWAVPRVSVVIPFRAIVNTPVVDDARIT